MRSYLAPLLLWLPLLWLCVSTVHAQPPTYCIGSRDRYTCNVTHDVGHSLTSIAVAEAARLLPNQNEWTRYMIGTIWFPLAHEIVDQFRWPDHKWSESWKDILTYQAAWSVPLIQNGYIVEGVVVAAVVLAFIHSRYRHLSTTFRIRLRI